MNGDGGACAASRGLGAPWRILAAVAAGQASLGFALAAAALGLQVAAAWLAVDVALPAALWWTDGARLFAPAALAVAAPTALAIQSWRWRQDGRWLAAAVAGVSPAALAAAALVVWLPWLAVQPELWHRAQPAARARFEDAARRALLAAPERLVPALAAVGVAARLDADGGGRALLPDARHGAIGVAFRSLAAAPEPPGGLDLRGVRVVTPDPGAPGAAEPGREPDDSEPRAAVDPVAAERVTLAITPWRPSLAERSERQLDTALLVDNAARWRRARQVRGPFPAAERARAEAWRRRAAVGAGWFGAGVGAAAWWRRPRPATGVLAMLPGLAVLLGAVVLAPRLAALAAGWVAP